MRRLLSACNRILVSNEERGGGPLRAARFASLHSLPDNFVCRLDADGYVDDNRKVKWCPSVPHCGRAVRINSDPHVEVTCHCGQQFCFACNDPPHTPATCEM